MEPKKEPAQPKQDKAKRRNLEASDYLISNYTIRPQSPNSMVLAQKQAHRLMEQNRKKPKYLQPTGLRQSKQKHEVGKGHPFQQMVLG